MSLFFCSYFVFMTQPEALQKILQAIASGDLSPETALEKLKHLPFESLYP
jgi:pyridinium-3,5-biscarboxylic acid mononucleotide synthase